MKKNFLPNHVVLFVLCWILYYSSYLGRLNYSAAMVDLIKVGDLSPTFAGLISTTYFFSYASGQIINGILADKLSPKYMPVIGILISCLANIFMCSSSFLPLFWGINGFAQSMIWPSMVKIITSYMPENVKLKAFTYISSTIPASAISSYLISALILKHINVNAVFYIPAIIMFVSATIYLFFFPKITMENSEKSITKKAKTMSIKSIVFAPIILISLFPIFVQGVMKDGFSTWVPNYISETFNASTVTSILVTIALPFINLIGTYLVCYMQKKFSNELLLAGIFFIISFFTLLLLILLGNKNLIVSLILLSVGSTAILAINTVFVSYVPMNFSKYNRSAFVSGFLNASAYAGAATSTFVIGFLTENFGWNYALFCFIILTLISSFVCIFNRKRSFDIS